LQLSVLRTGTEREIDAAFANLVELHADALLVSGDPFFTAGASSSWRWHPAMLFRPSIYGETSRRPAV
jgi:hypothetical protein